MKLKRYKLLHLNLQHNIHDFHPKEEGEKKNDNIDASMLHEE